MNLKKQIDDYEFRMVVYSLTTLFIMCGAIELFPDYAIGFGLVTALGFGVFDFFSWRHVPKSVSGDIQDFLLVKQARESTARITLLYGFAIASVVVSETGTIWPFTEGGILHTPGDEMFNEIMTFAYGGLMYSISTLLVDVFLNCVNVKPKSLKGE